MDIKIIGVALTFIAVISASAYVGIDTNKKVENSVQVHNVYYYVPQFKCEPSANRKVECPPDRTPRIIGWELKEMEVCSRQSDGSEKCIT